MSEVSDPSPAVLLSAFADEATRPASKAVPEQLAAVAAAGLKWYSPRWVQFGTDAPKHVVECTDAELGTLRGLHGDFGVGVTSIGSRVGKVKLVDGDDGSGNKFVPFDDYLAGEVADTIRVANALGTKLVRGFSFYHPRGSEVRDHFPQAVEQIRRIADACGEAGLVYGLEIEPNLVGETGELLRDLGREVASDHLALIFDGGNVAAQNKHPVQVYEEYVLCAEQLGWMHIKDYRIDPSLVWDGHVDEDRLKNFVPADRGDAGHELILRDLKTRLPKLTSAIQAKGVPGFFLEVEPHLKGGGQFGGFSGPDGMGVAVRALCRLLDYVGIAYKLRDFEDIRRLRGF